MAKAHGKFFRTGGKTGGRDFKPGVSGNPKGRPKAPADQKLALAQIRESQSQLRFAWQHHYEELSNLSQQELQYLVNHGANENVLRLLVANSILYAMKTGRGLELQIHKELMCGPEPKQIELSGPAGEPLTPIANYSQEKLSVAFNLLDAALKAKESEEPLRVISTPDDTKD